MAIFSRSLPTLIALAYAVLVGQPAVSQTASRRLAVLGFKGKIADDALDTIADAVRGGAVEGLAGSGVDVMTREDMMVLLNKIGTKGCTEGDCDVQTARNIRADFAVSGSVVQIDSAFVVTLKLHETKGGSLLATDQIEAKSQSDLLRQLREHGRNLVTKNLGSRPAPPPIRRRVPKMPKHGRRYLLRPVRLPSQCVAAQPTRCSSLAGRSQWGMTSWTPGLCTR